MSRTSAPADRSLADFAFPSDFFSKLFSRAEQAAKVEGLYSLLKNSNERLCNNGTASAGPIMPAE
jgi:hypothetical protein